MAMFRLGTDFGIRHFPSRWINVHLMKRVTLRDVAEHAGVSRASASMVVRGTGRLSEDTRARVRESMRALGYVYHRGAATLRTNRSGVLGLLVTDVSNPFFSAMTLGFEDAASKAGFMTILTNTFDSRDRQDRLVQAMLEYPVDGFAYTPSVGSEHSRVFGENVPMPVLAVTRNAENGVPSLVPDDLQGGTIAAEHLVSVHGAKRLVYLGGPEEASTRSHRVHGVELALRNHAGARLVKVLPGHTSVRGGIELANELLESGTDFDAVVCHSDVVAFSLLHTLEREEYRDRRVGVIGFDGLPESEVFSPSVTSVAVGPELIGARAAEWLLAELQGGTPVDLSPMEMTLQIRQSCGCGVPLRIAH
jgi:LacI family transcriptional regulator